VSQQWSSNDESSTRCEAPRPWILASVRPKRRSPVACLTVRAPPSTARQSAHRPASSIPGADIRAAVERITIRRTTLDIQLAEGTAEDSPDRILVIPGRRHRPIDAARSFREEADDLQPCDRCELRRALLIGAFRDAYCWHDELMRDSSRTFESIAVHEKKTERSTRMKLSLSFLSPILVKAAIEGRLSRGFGVKRLMDLPMAWSDQWSALGL
jgi:site-specific DNA recombinase